MLDGFKTLNRRGVMGMNRRNLEWIYPHNPRRRFPLVDDKPVTKDILAAARLPVPETISVVRYRGDMDACIEALRGEPGFAIKPARGLGGNGLLTARRDGERWVRPSGKIVSAGDIAYHLATILSGMYSLSRSTDKALVEMLVEDTRVFGDVHGASGVSDVRIIVHEGRPAMAMLRMPCQASGGAANLHAGGLGLGIDMETGVTTHAIREGKPCERHPDTGEPLRGIRVPDWDFMLDVARRTNALFGLGYLGVDVVVDERVGPLVLEVNARPGLAIQLANRRGLRGALNGGAGGTQ